MSVDATFLKGPNLSRAVSEKLERRWSLRKAWTDVLYALHPFLEKPESFSLKDVQQACKIFYFSFHALQLDLPLVNRAGFMVNALLRMGAPTIEDGIPMFILSFPSHFRDAILQNYQTFASALDRVASPKEAVELLSQLKGQNKRSASNLPEAFVRGKTFVVRVDYNDVHKPYADDIRLNASLETQRYILERGGKLVVLAHRGRPEGFDQQHANDSLVEAVSTVLPGVNIQRVDAFCHDEHMASVVYPGAVEAAAALSETADLVLMDNLRFDVAETSSSWSSRHPFATFLSMLGDVYVLDGYPISHRDNTSVTTLPLYMPSVGGFWLEREIEEHRGFYQLINGEERGPMLCMFGGIKPDKLQLIERLCANLRKGDVVFIGGGLA
ncbi:MAG: phosphoglycerate kinase [Candidatus Saganbacteria bacterium]|nr:phosphoglycerate kinase [Candidatus Saganbacteria bacterium]